MGGPIYFTSLYRNLTLENAYTHKNRINLSQKVAQRTFFNFWRRIKTLNRNIKLELKELWDINNPSNWLSRESKWWRAKKPRMIFLELLHFITRILACGKIEFQNIKAVIPCRHDLLWCGVLSKWEFFIKMRAAFIIFYPPSSYEGRREQGRQLSFWWKTLNLIGHYGSNEKQ